MNGLAAHFQTQLNRQANAGFKHAADVVAWMHLVWLSIVITSLPLMLIITWYKYVAIVSVGITVGSWLIFGDCPLFMVENHLRKQCDPQHKFSGSFLTHYLKKYLSLEIPPSLFTFLGITYAVLVFTLAFKK